MNNISSFLSINKKIFILSATFVSLNFWIWMIFDQQQILAGLLIITTLFSFYYLLTFKKSILLILILLTLPIYYFQFMNTDYQNLSELTPTEIHLKNNRMVSYPISQMEIAGRSLNYPLGNILDGRPETNAWYQYNQNLFETLDLNYYFFATHPRERVEYNEFEKYPFFYLIFLIAGLLTIKYAQLKIFLTVLFLIPLLFISLIGTVANLGSSALYPFLGSVMMYGLYSILDIVKIKFKKLSR